MMLSLINPSPVTLSITTGVGGCNISWSVIHREAPCWQLKNKSPCSSSMVLASTTLFFLRSTWMGPLRFFCGRCGWVFRWYYEVVIPTHSAFGACSGEKKMPL